MLRFSQRIKPEWAKGPRPKHPGKPYFDESKADKAMELLEWIDRGGSFEEVEGYPELMLYDGELITPKKAVEYANEKLDRIYDSIEVLKGGDTTLPVEDDMKWIADGMGMSYEYMEEIIWDAYDIGDPHTRWVMLREAVDEWLENFNRWINA